MPAYMQAVSVQLSATTARDPAPGRRGVRRDRPARRLEGPRRAGRDARLALDGAERAGRARAARPAHAPAHLGGPRPDRPRLPLLRDATCSSGSSPGRRRSPLDLVRRRAARSRRRCRRRPRCSPQATRLLALVSAPPLAGRRRCGTSRCCCSSRRCVVVVVITSTGGVTKRVVAFDEPGRPGPRQLGAAVPERAASSACSSGRGCSGGALDDPGLSPRASATFLERLAPAFTELVAADEQRALRRRCGRPARRRARRRASRPTARLLELLERRARPARRCSPRRSTRAARSSASATSSTHPALHDAGARRRRLRPRRTARSARSACSARCGWTTTRRSARCAPPRPSSRRFVEELVVRADELDQARATLGGRWRRPSATTTRCSASQRGATDAEIKRAFRGLARELHPDVSDAPDAEERFREVVEAYEVLSNAERRELYDRYGHEGLRGGGFTPATSTSATSPTCSRRSSATTSSASAVARRRGRRTGPTSAPRSRSSSSRRRTASSRRCPFQVATCRAAAARGAAPSPAPSPSSARRAAAPAGCSRSRAASSASSSAHRPARAAAAPAGWSSIPCKTCRGDGRVLEERAARGRRSRRGSTTASASASRGEGHAARPAARRATCTCSSTSRTTSASSRDGRRHRLAVDLTMTQAALGGTVTVPTLDGDVELEFEPGTQPGEVRRAAAGRACRCSRGSGAATTACSSTSPCRGA